MTAAQAVMVHQLSKKATQNPFRKNKGRVVRVLFHPTQVFLALESPMPHHLLWQSSSS